MRLESLIYKDFALTSRGRSEIIRSPFMSISGVAGLILRLSSFFVAAFLAAGFAAFGVADADAASPRPIPDAARKAKVSFAGGAAYLGGDPLRLSPGAQIRDESNRIVLPSHLRGEYRMRVLVDATGQLHRAWILTPEEIAAPEPKQ